MGCSRVDRQPTLRERCPTGSGRRSANPAARVLRMARWTP